MKEFVARSGYVTIEDKLRNQTKRIMVRHRAIYQPPYPRYTFGFSRTHEYYFNT